jgi:predicted unusual protein kinase regulating ubiquinone biosynthesis (AarF/ABC1/UbiB family)
VWQFSKVGASMLSSALIDATLQTKSKEEGSFLTKYLVSEKNAEKLSEQICRMRGAALKVGQILSI